MLRDIDEPNESDMMVIPKPTFDCESEESVQESFTPSLVALCTDVVSRNLEIDSALAMFKDADSMMNEQLKLNCLKFISLNIVSYLETGPNFEKLISLPVYLLRDL
jgi:hypothetical protein